jgi:hypothetical protein
VPAPALGKPQDEPSDPKEPSPAPGGPVEVDGVIDWQADTSPFAQLGLVESCCPELPGLRAEGLVCALAAATDKATKKTINIRKYLLTLLLMLLSSGVVHRAPLMMS